MKNLIDTLLVAVGIRKTTSGAISGITKAIAQLEAVAVRENAKSDKHWEKARENEKCAEAAYAEADKARGIAFRLDGLLNG